MSKSILDMAMQLQQAAEGVNANKQRATRESQERLDFYVRELQEFEAFMKGMRISDNMLQFSWRDIDIDQTSACRVLKIKGFQTDCFTLTVNVGLNGNFKLEFNPALTDHSLEALRGAQGNYALSYNHMDKSVAVISKGHADKVITCIVAWLTDRDKTFPDQLKKRVELKREEAALANKGSKTRTPTR